MSETVIPEQLHVARTYPEEAEHYGPQAICWRNLSNGRVIALHEMLFNVRLCAGWQMDTGYDRGFCYPKDAPGWVTAINAVLEWDGEGDPPDGWIKDVMGRRWRPDGDPTKEHGE